MVKSKVGRVYPFCPKNWKIEGVLMGFYFRKSKSLGPVRLNFSKSGLGVSTGVKGARLSFGPRGTYVNLGRNGIYYRKKLGGNNAGSKKPNRKAIHDNYNSTQPIINQQSEFDYSDAIRVYDNSYSDSVLGQEIIKDIKKSKAFFWIWIVLSFILIGVIQEWGLLIAIASGIILWRFFTARVVYDLEPEAEFEWKKLNEILFGLRSSNRLWLIENETYNSNRKVNAGASSTVVRGNANVLQLKPNRKTGFGVKTNVSSFVIRSAKCQILFLPSGIIVKKGSKQVAYSFDQINIVSATVNFVESEAVPRDAEVIRHTWLYVNKDGSPDRRYSGNRQIPVCRYGVIRITGSNISLELQTSNRALSSNVGNAYTHYQTYYSKIGNAGFTPEPQKVTPVVGNPGQPTANQYISQEEWSLLEQMDDTIRDLGRKGFTDLFNDEMKCRVSFINGQVHDDHAILLFRAEKAVDDQLSRIEYNLNANTEFRNTLEAVSDREFLVHLYMDPYKGTKELPLSKDIEDALLRAKEWKKISESTSGFSGISEDDDYSSILSEGADLFSGDIDETDKKSDDPYGDLFNTSNDKEAGNSSGDNDPVDDLMSFFDEE